MCRGLPQMATADIFYKQNFLYWGNVYGQRGEEQAVAPQCCPARGGSLHRGFPPNPKPASVLHQPRRNPIFHLAARHEGRRALKLNRHRKDLNLEAPKRGSEQEKKKMLTAGHIYPVFSL